MDSDHAYDLLTNPRPKFGDFLLELVDIARFYGRLGAIDGALLMTDRFKLKGFGVKLTPSATLTEVTQHGHPATVREIGTFGTRHASAMRYCNDVPEAFAYIVSEDGEIKAVRKDANLLHYWPRLVLDEDIL